MTKFLSVSACAAILSVMTINAAVAEPIDFELTLTGSGSIGGTSFTDANLVFSALGDTSKVQPSDFLSTEIGVPVTVTIDGVGAYTISNEVDLVSNSFTQNVGLGIFSAGGGIFVDAGSSTYDLTTSFGPVTGPASVALTSPLTTSMGALSFTLSRSDGTVEAQLGTPAAVPEPTSWALLISGFGMTGVALRRRARNGLQAV